MTKHDEQNDLLTCYAYDTDFDPIAETWDANLCFTPNDPLVLTRNNRLLEYREFGPESGGNRALLRTVRYWYDQYGLARHIVVKDEGYATYRDLNLTYTPSGQLWLAVEMEWTEPTWSPNEQQVTILPAWEFRYDAPRQRYLKRLLEYDDFAQAYVPSATELDVWTDYLGDQPYVDYDVSDSGGGLAATELQRYLAALGVHAEQDVAAQGTPETYYHPDLTGSTTVTTDETGAQSARTAYTAFGELVDANGVVGYDPTVAPPTRYQYDGAYGYESGLIVLYGANPGLPPITLQHLGARWYQPDIGRFVQRDPIGLRGGMNVYSYLDADPVKYVDPSGLLFQDPGCDIRFQPIIDAVLSGDQKKAYDIMEAQATGATAGLGVLGGWQYGATKTAVVCIFGWTSYRMAGGSTGNGVINAGIDGFSWGASAHGAWRAGKGLINDVGKGIGGIWDDATEHIGDWIDDILKL